MLCDKQTLSAFNKILKHFQTVTHEDVTFEDLGGSKVHTSKSGMGFQTFYSEIVIVKA